MLGLVLGYLWIACIEAISGFPLPVGFIPE